MSNPAFTQNFNCANYWWRNLLNINNFFKVAAPTVACSLRTIWVKNCDLAIQEETMCAGWTWYLANDFQFFLVSPVGSYS